MLASGFTIGSLNLLTSILSVAPDFLRFSKKQSGITALNSAQISSFRPYTFFASTAYCPPSTTKNWSCAHCAANSDFSLVASGGDGGFVQYWYVGYSPSQATVIVAHQGTDTHKIEAVARDADFFFESLDATLFPGVNHSSIKVHSGFADEQAKTARKVLSAVQIAIAEHGATQVTTVGHSLGAAISLLDVLYLPLHISGDVSFRMIGYGMPRVGNQAFADYVDDNLSVDVTHINNKKDFVPIIPGRDMDYHHPSGEVHIMENDQWVSCPGQDNPSKMCSVGFVPDLRYGNVTDHSGPFDNVVMGEGC